MSTGNGHGRHRHGGHGHGGDGHGGQSPLDMDMDDMDMVDMDMVDVDMMNRKLLVNFIYLGSLPRIISRTCLDSLVLLFDKNQTI